jgi:hypothetical protein
VESNPAYQGAQLLTDEDTFCFGLQLAP